jgi:hypothetical protein
MHTGNPLNPLGWVNAAQDWFRETGRSSGFRRRFIVTELSENREAWLTSKSWYLMSNKELKPGS